MKLTREEREYLEELIHHGRHAADRRRRAQILLLVDEGEFGPALPDSEAAQTMNVSRRNVEMVRERCVMEGLEQAVDSALAATIGIEGLGQEHRQGVCGRVDVLPVIWLARIQFSRTCSGLSEH